MKISRIFLIISLILILFSININLTSYATLEAGKISFTPLFYLGLIFFILFILTTSKSLETIMILIGNEEAMVERTKKAIEEFAKNKEKPYILISGEIERDERNRPRKDSQQYQIYTALRENNFLPKQLIIEGKSKDSLENFLYSIKRLEKKGIKKLNIATSPLHYARFKLFEKKAKKTGLIEKDFEINPLYTKNTENPFYGILAYIKDYFRVNSTNSLEEARNKSYLKAGIKLKNKLNPLKK